jgi:hypothetical protein
MVGRPPGCRVLFLDEIVLPSAAAWAARAAERREAISRASREWLEDASHELELPRATESEARPGSWAHPASCSSSNPTAGDMPRASTAHLGYSADDPRPVPDDRWHGRRSGRQGEVGSGDAAPDGTTFPVDFAVSTFESQGELSSIAVLTDITDRLETDHLRDTFIGILSHELRTPVTAIYGGSQVLLGRGEKLDPTVSRELIVDIAAEAERFHRLIENLPVLAGSSAARIDRWRAGPCCSVPPTILERERAIWSTDIVATVARSPTVRGHDGYVSQVIRNLLSSQIRRPPGSEIVAEGDEDGVSVRVLDDGPGTSPRSRNAFRPYYRRRVYYRRRGCRHRPIRVSPDRDQPYRSGQGAADRWRGVRLPPPIYEADEDLCRRPGAGRKSRRGVPKRSICGFGDGP